MGSSRPTSARRIATLVHRYVGLGLAGFLIVVGLTGAMIAWNHDLERVFAPSLFVLPPGPVRALDPFALREAAARAVPGYAVNGVDFTRAAGQPAFFQVEARPGGPAPPDDEIALDPATGRIVGARRHGDLRQGAINLMPFVYDLHDSLALGDTGITVLGIVALVWTADCFVGAYLTFPARGPRAGSRRRWLARWGKAWSVRRGAATFRLIFDLHRAGGLWLWLLLLIIAWSSVGLNLPQVYKPVMATLFGVEAEPPSPPARDPLAAPRLGWRAAHALARAAMERAAAHDGFTVRAERLMFYGTVSHVYEYRVRSSRDPGRLGNTTLRVDGDTGAISPVAVPTGRGWGHGFTTWIVELHTAGVFGPAWQVVLTLTGLGIAMLSVTGILVWLRKRSARHGHQRGHLRGRARG